MKCIKCNKDAKKKDRDLHNNRCPSCHHPFVTEPSTDGITDMQIKKAQDEVSANSTLFFSKAQLKYQLQRQIKKKLRTHKIAVIVSVLTALLMLILAFSKGGFFIPAVVFSGFISLAIVSEYIRRSKALSRLDKVLSQWITINPHEKLLTTAKFQENQRAPNYLDGVSFDRVLVCDRNDTVDFFLSNLFHFHYSCPVLGGNGYPQGIYEDMLVRLKQNPNLKVFLLHDYSPAGAAFVRRMKTDNKWFASIPAANIIDLGLNVGQKKLFKAMTIKKADRNQKIQETAELSLFKPAAIIALCGVAINEGLPLDLVSIASAADSGSTGGYG
jgi:hypothetical protein